MSVLIKGMEMPKNCYGCLFFAQVDYLNKNDEADIMSKCKRTGEFTWECVNGYLPNCPLVPVPPHGRLIDADALDAGLKEMSEIEWNQKAFPVSWAYAFDAFRDIIERDEPTIIEAEPFNSLSKPCNEAEEGE